MKDFQKETDPAAPSQEQVSDKYLPKNTKKEEQSSLDQLVPKRGDHNLIVSSISKELIAESEKVSGFELDENGKQEIINFVTNVSRGPATYMTMICKGENCPFWNHCPLVKAKSKLPYGKPCPVERSAMSAWISKHIEALGIENPNSPENSFDMDMLFELAGQELIRWRCSLHLSDRPELMEERQVGSTVTGDPIFADVINPVLDIMERAGRNVHRIRESLLATRESQIRAGQHALDPSKEQSDIKQKVQDLINRNKEKRAIKDITNNQDE